MKRVWCLALALVLSSSVQMTPTAAQQQSAINLTMEQRHTLKELLLKDNPIAKQATNVSVGATLGPEVKLQPLPPLVAGKVPQIKQHLYLLTNDSIVLVSADDRKVVEVIKDEGN